MKTIKLNTSDNNWEQLLIDDKLYFEGHSFSNRDWMQVIKDLLPDVEVFIQYQQYDEDTDEEINLELEQIK